MFNSSFSKIVFCIIYFNIIAFNLTANIIFQDSTTGKSLHINFWNQTMMRYYDLNPGTMVKDEEVTNMLDVGIRRMRMSADIQPIPIAKIFIQVGINNQSFLTGGGTGTGGNGYGKKPGLFFHDAYSSFTVVNKKSKKHTDRIFSMHLGAGLHAWTGVSRLTNGSSNKILNIDFPLFNFPTLERSDQFGRQLGIFTHGNIAKFNYRFSVNKPFATDMVPAKENTAVDASSHKTLSKAGYVYYQFKEIENNTTAFLAGTYLGDKEILNIGGGFYQANDATQSRDGNKIQKHNNLVLGFDIFYDKPFSINNKKSNLTVYSVLYQYNYGPNYTRLAGVMNPGTLSASATLNAFEGAGNNHINLGTGRIFYTQTAWVLPSNNTIKFQPFGTYAYKNLTAIKQIGHFYDIGTHVLINKHQAKLSLQYSNKPLYAMDAQQVLKRTNEWIACVQVLF